MQVCPGFRASPWRPSLRRRRRSWPRIWSCRRIKQRREGEILGVADGKLRIKIGPAETSLPMDQVASVTKAPPKAYDDAMNAWQDGNANKALGLLKPIVETFRGLPTDWAERSSALLGDVYLSLEQLPAAEAAFAEFANAYPGSKSRSDISLARLCRLS